MSVFPLLVIVHALATKLPLTTWFLAFYLIGQAKTGISSLELSRHLGVKYDTAWLLHNKILRAMADREDAHRYRGNGAGVMATLRTAALNLLRLAGSARSGPGYRR